MNKEILPLGSVVTLKHGDGSVLMIIARASVVKENEEEVYYDYGSVLIPLGMARPEVVYFFNKENVEEVLFKGFENEDEKEFAQQYDEMIARSKFSKGSVEK
ncbi:DUF4176 domain-containing protein [Lactococcus nasutitermitis]|uniref:DUF4176 domain-containing protein n=1 Tax=Lactococcus nasutitermitis TaxID=1652957 RepID=A0ABV9JD18_9LACT|nr:DUF4176 domain-containing protein [Lactococcus nasutitermitis]